MRHILIKAEHMLQSTSHNSDIFGNETFMYRIKLALVVVI